MCFKNVHLFKPITSKPGNSEVYIICLKYCGFRRTEKFIEKLMVFYGVDDFLTRSLFSLNFVPKLFLENLFDACNLFFSHQYRTIERNISIFENGSSSSKTFKNIYKRQKTIMKIFMAQTRLHPIDEEHKICNHSQMDENQIAHFHCSSFESYTERKRSSEALKMEKFLKYRRDLSELTENFDSLPSIFKCEHLPKVPFAFIQGKPIKTLCSSKFVYIQIWKVSLEFNLFQTKKTRDISLNRNNDGHTISFTELNDTELKHNLTLKCIREALDLMKENDNLIFENFMLFTQFNVGILYILAMLAFEKITFCENSLIELKSFKNKVETIDYFDILLTNITDAEQISNKSIVGILPLKCILSEPFYSIVCNFNNFNLVKIINNTIDKMLASPCE